MSSNCGTFPQPSKARKIWCVQVQILKAVRTNSQALFLRRSWREESVVLDCCWEEQREYSQGEDSALNLLIAYWQLPWVKCIQVLIFMKNWRWRKNASIVSWYLIRLSSFEENHCENNSKPRARWADDCRKSGDDLTTTWANLLQSESIVQRFILFDFTILWLPFFSSFVYGGWRRRVLHLPIYFTEVTEELQIFWGYFVILTRARAIDLLPRTRANYLRISRDKNWENVVSGFSLIQSS
jgi:hypothetical protein